MKNVLEDSGLLGCDTVSLSAWFLTCQRSILLLLSWVTWTRRLEFFTTPLWKLENSQIMFSFDVIGLPNGHFLHVCVSDVSVILHIQTIFTPYRLMSLLHWKCPMPGIDDGHLLASLCSPHLNSSLVNNTVYFVQHNLYTVYCGVVCLIVHAQRDGSC
jgi:hypothetical protein